MHTIYSMLNTYKSALALGFILLVFCVGPVWAQEFATLSPGGEGGGEGWELPDSLSGGGEGGGEGWERLGLLSTGGYAGDVSLNPTGIYSPGGEGGGEGWELPDSLSGGGEGGGEGWERVRMGDSATVISGTVEQPEQPALLGNYPNPFNPETTVRFELRTAQQVRLSVFNVLGQRVRLLVDGQVEAGIHEARFEAYGLPSGTYFTRLETATGVVTHTMILTK